ncbi:unnamed protein product [Ectocarpus sp. CCAP 1310/34]|nr:unnamed protein product [Ectocarpus sp. CCAP 1310/34]
MTNALTSDAVLDEAQKSEIIEDWAETWRGTTKLGFTSHMLLSFPTDVTVDQVRDITLEWAEHFFDSGEYGDQWDYVLAVHDDRAHKHAHILLNNRGVDQGTWFSCWAEGVMSPQLMREKQAEIAEKHGIMLDATTRLERGIYAKPAGMEEIYAAKAQARRPQEIALTEQERAMAEAQVTAFAKDYKSVADFLDRMDQRAIGSAVRSMAEAMGRGAPWHGPGKNEQTGEIDMKDITTVGQATEYAERAIEAIGLKIEELDASARAAFEVKTAPVLKELSRMVPDPELQSRFNKVLLEPYPPGAGDAAFVAELTLGNDDALEKLEAVINGELKVELTAALGERGIAALRNGNYAVLDDALPSKFDQITVAQEYLEMMREETGDLRAAILMTRWSLASLDRIYGPEGRESLENGAGLKLYITPRDQRTVREVSAAVGSTTREAVTRMYGRNKGVLGATSTSTRLEERPLLSETEARLMDPDEVIILASPQHPIKAQRIKYYDDPLFKELVEKQEGRAFPYPPIVEGVGPWEEIEPKQGKTDAEGEPSEQAKPANQPEDRNALREARAMMMGQDASGETEDLHPTPDPDDPLPPEWEDVLLEQSDFLDALMEEQGLGN